jgi:hypothetical protein
MSRTAHESLQPIFFGYDEQAHRRGPGSAFAHWTLKGIDGVVRDIYRTAMRSRCRNYQIVIYADHGQERVKNYRLHAQKPSENGYSPSDSKQMNTRNLLDTAQDKKDVRRLAGESLPAGRQCSLRTASGKASAPETHLPPRLRTMSALRPWGRLDMSTSRAASVSSSNRSTPHQRLSNSPAV